MQCSWLWSNHEDGDGNCDGKINSIGDVALYPKYIDKYFGDMKVTRKASTDLESSITE
jgi:hypothetical protein